MENKIQHPIENGTLISVFDGKKAIIYPLLASSPAGAAYRIKFKENGDFAHIYKNDVEEILPIENAILHPLPIGTEVFSKTVDGHILSATLVKDGMYLYKVKHKYSERVFDVPSGYVFLSEDELKKSLKTDMVNHPQHYGGKDNPMEVIKIIDHYQLGFVEGSILKYLLRYKKKNGLEDLKKAQWYINRLIEKQGD